MANNYPKFIAETVKDLPVKEQAEVYDFAKFLKARNNVKKSRNPNVKTKPRHSILDLCGIGESDVTDGSINHDKYLYGE